MAETFDNIYNNHHHRFTAIIQVNLHQPAPPVKNWSILLVQSFTACMPSWRQPAHLDQGEDAGVLLNSVIYTVSIHDKIY